MKIKSGSSEIKDARNATVQMDSGDYLSISYTDPRGVTNIFQITAQHLMFMAVHEGTDKSLICRPSGVSTVY